MTHHQVQHTIRAKAMFLSPMNDFEIAMILADIKCLPSRITGYIHGPAWTRQHLNELQPLLRNVK